MCGIIGYTGKRNAKEVLLHGLKLLEYRGYDSAGICLQNKRKMEVYKCTGKIRNLTHIVPLHLTGVTGIGHTRWATHGGVTNNNSHPHLDSSGKLAICHNGIVENYTTLKEKLESEGVEFKSETDSEVIAHLIARFYKGDLEKAVKQALSLLEGTYGLVCIHQDEPERIIGARNGSPLVLGIGDGEMFLASDINAIMPYTKQVVYLEDGEIISLDRSEYRTTDFHDVEISKAIEVITWDLDSMEKAGFSHYMEKEIFEQPESILRAFQGRLELNNATGHLGGLNLSCRELLDVERIRIIAAGTSFYAGLVAAYMLEHVARIPAVAELASEIRYRNPIVEKNTLYFAVSQSGETMDTLFALRELKRRGARVLGICNVVGSSIARESDGGVYIHSGPEIAVASTKAFTSQITVLLLFTLIIARMRHMSFEDGQRIIGGLESLPGNIRTILQNKAAIKKIAEKYAFAKSFLFLGRGINYPVALEGALKLKEISYIHAEGFSAAEIKHGPIALINSEIPSFFLVPRDRLRDKVISNMKEVSARGGKIIVVCTEGDDETAAIADEVIFVPHVDEIMSPFLMTVPLQLFAYYVALKLNRDVDQPRNLAKSVTVE